MYAHCLFCTSALGHNESLEHFPVGRRLAYDPARGRLWVVCRSCERWNLTPLEVRWEAIEEAESLYRQSRLRIATENIGLAQLGEGLELVRIGRPPTLELAGWRYGDQFGRRRRKHFGQMGIGIAVATIPILGTLPSAISIAYSSFLVTTSVLRAISSSRDTRVPRVLLPDETGTILPLSVHDACNATLVPLPGSSEWHLSIRHRRPGGPDGSAVLRAMTGRKQAREPVTLKGDVALRALASLLPHANFMGGSRRKIHDAVRVIEDAPNVDRLVYRAATSHSFWTWKDGSNQLAGLPAPLRLALEMVLHDEQERVALEGELAALEQRWREAEEIAAIADSLLVEPATEERLAVLKGTSRE